LDPDVVSTVLAEELVDVTKEVVEVKVLVGSAGVTVSVLYAGWSSLMGLSKDTLAAVSARSVDEDTWDNALVPALVPVMILDSQFLPSGLHIVTASPALAPSNLTLIVCVPADKL
jgi:hypothetical protein